MTISKIRFLESQGLVDPERTPSGYRKFYDHDVERLRWILRQQRENFLPLKIIRGRLTEQGEDLDEAAAGGRTGRRVRSVRRGRRRGSNGADISDARAPAPAGPSPIEAATVTHPSAGGRAASGAPRTPAADGDGTGRRPGPRPRRPPRARPSSSDPARPSAPGSPSRPAGPGAPSAPPPAAARGAPSGARRPRHPRGAVRPCRPVGPHPPARRRPMPHPSPGQGDQAGPPPRRSSPPRPRPVGPRPPHRPSRHRSVGLRPAGRAPPGSPPEVGAAAVRRVRPPLGEDAESYSAEELAGAAGGTVGLVTELQEFGLITTRAVVGGTPYFDAARARPWPGPPPASPVTASRPATCGAWRNCRRPGGGPVRTGDHAAAAPAQPRGPPPGRRHPGGAGALWAATCARRCSTRRSARSAKSGAGPHRRAAFQRRSRTDAGGGNVLAWWRCT